MYPPKKIDKQKANFQLESEVRTDGPANREVPESAIAEQPPSQYPEIQYS